MRGEGCLPALTSPCLRPLLRAANPAAGVYFGAGVRASPRGDGGWEPSLVVCFGPFSQLGRWGAARTWGVRAVRAAAGCPKVPPVPAEGMGQCLWCCLWGCTRQSCAHREPPQFSSTFYEVFGASLPKKILLQRSCSPPRLCPIRQTPPKQLENPQGARSFLQLGLGTPSVGDRQVEDPKPVAPGRVKGTAGWGFAALWGILFAVGIRSAQEALGVGSQFLGWPRRGAFPLNSKPGADGRWWSSSQRA